ncbi:MAG: chemotaxis protein CheA [Desulfobacterales bacterium]
MDQEPLYIETFRQEARELLTSVEDAVLDMEEKPNNPDCVHRLFRFVHTIKGSGAMCGFHGIAEFTHHVETVLDKVRSGEIPVSSELTELILMAGDHLKSMLDAPDDEKETVPAGCEAIIAKFKALMPESEEKAEPLPVQTDLAPESAEKETVFCIRFRPDSDMMSRGMDPAVLLQELRELGDCEITLCTDNVPPLCKLETEKLYLSWDIVLTTFHDYDTVAGVFLFVQEESEIRIQPLDDHEENPSLPGEILTDREESGAETVQEVPEKQNPVENLPEKSGKLSDETPESALDDHSVPEKQKYGADTDGIRISSERLDRLINLVGEMVVTQAHLSELAEENEQSPFSGPVRQMERLSRELRDFALKMRMVPVNTVFSKFRRMVRDLAAELRKEVQLIIEGGETELDKSILDRLYDPLVHMIRNSMDHGLQSPEIRQQQGKPRKGTIHLTAAHQGARVEISVADDGMGIDQEEVHRRAAEKGLISPDAEPDDEQMHSLIFLPGFSTAKKVSDISGRGVGMDVVKQEISALGGTIRISSVKGEGTKVHLSLPLTLAIITGLHVRTEGRDFILPVSHVESCEELKDIRSEKSGTRQMIRFKREQIPFLRLRDVFRIPGPGPSAEQAALVQTGNSRIAVVCDEIIGSIQTVIKPLDRIYRHAKGISGATIMGNGSIALIIDLPELVQCVKRDEKSGRMKNAFPDSRH